MKTVLIILFLTFSQIQAQDIIIGKSLQPILSEFNAGNNLQNTDFSAAINFYPVKGKISLGIGAEANIDRYNTFGASVVSKYQIAPRISVSAGIGGAMTRVAGSVVTTTPYSLNYLNVEYSPLINLSFDYKVISLLKGDIYAGLNYKRFHYSAVNLYHGADTLRISTEGIGDILLRVRFEFK